MRQHEGSALLHAFLQLIHDSKDHGGVSPPPPLRWAGWENVPGHVSTQESIPFTADFAGPGYFNDLDMLIVGNMSEAFYGGPSRLNLTETKAHLALWAILKSPMLLSCDVRSLDADVRALLTNDDMLAVVNDPLARQGRRLQTADGAALAVRVTFNTCPPNGSAPLARQRWSMGSNGKITSVVSGRVLTLASCGDGDPSVVLCGSGPRDSSTPAPCRNSSCPSASTWNPTTSEPWKVGSAPMALTNAYSGHCLEGMLGFYQAVRANTCDTTNPKQQWVLLADGTLRSFGQCLTAEMVANAHPPPVEVYAAAMKDGSVTVVLFNTGSAATEGSLPLRALGWSDNTTVNVRDIWAQRGLPSATRVFSAEVAPHGVVFVRLSPVRAK